MGVVSYLFGNSFINPIGYEDDLVNDREPYGLLFYAGILDSDSDDFINRVSGRDTIENMLFIIDVGIVVY